MGRLRRKGPLVFNVPCAEVLAINTPRTRRRSQWHAGILIRAKLASSPCQVGVGTQPRNTSANFKPQDPAAPLLLQQFTTSCHEVSFLTTF